MNILHLTATVDPMFGGPPMIAKRLAAAQASLGEKVQIMYFEDPARQEKVDRISSEIPFYKEVEAIALPAQGKVGRVLQGALKTRLRSLLPHVDVVHLHGVWEPMYLAAGQLCREFRKPYYVILNGMLHPWSLSQKAWKKRLMLSMGLRRMLNNAAGLHIGNEDEARLIEPVGLTARKMILPNGVFLEEVDPLPEAGTFRKAHPELGNDPFVLFLGRLHFKKGLDYLGQSFALAQKRHPNLRLVVVGPDNGASEELMRVVGGNGLSKRVHVYGPKFGARKYAALVDSLCFCLPSRQEGFSVAVLEAMASSTPVVISDQCFFPEVEKAEAGYVLPLKAEAFSDAICELAEDQGKREEMGRRARELVAKKYTWQEVARQSLEVYRGTRRGQAREQKHGPMVATLIPAMLIVSCWHPGVRNVWQ